MYPVRLFYVVCVGPHDPTTIVGDDLRNFFPSSLWPCEDPKLTIYKLTFF